MASLSLTVTWHLRMYEHAPSPANDPHQPVGAVDIPCSSGPSPTRLHVIVMPFAVFCCPKKKHRSIDTPCLDPMDFGVGDEPEPELLMRRGRVGLFQTEDDATEALQRTGKACSGQPWLKEFAFIVLECCDRSSTDVEA